MALRFVTCWIPSRLREPAKPGPGKKPAKRSARKSLMNCPGSKIDNLYLFHAIMEQLLCGKTGRAHSSRKTKNLDSFPLPC